MKAKSYCQIFELLNVNKKKKSVQMVILRSSLKMKIVFFVFYKKVTNELFYENEKKIRN